MSEANKNLVRRYLDEVGSQGNLDVVDEIFATDFVNHFPEFVGGDAVGSDKVKTFVAGMRKSDPDRKLTIEDLIAEDDKVVARLTYTGTQEGPLFGVAPTGKRVTYTGTAIFRLADGKIVDGWVNGDTLGCLQQIGAIPQMA